jgi:hypothetical protein
MLYLSGTALPTYSADGLLRTDDAFACSPSPATNLDLDKVIGIEVPVSIQLEGKRQ